MPSPDSIAVQGKPTRSAFLKKNQTRQVKGVHWDLSIKDNEFKNRSRSKSPVPNKKTATAEKVMAAQRSSSIARPTTKDIRGAQFQYPRPQTRGSQNHRNHSPHPTSKRARTAEDAKMLGVTLNAERRPSPTPAVAGPSRPVSSNQRPGTPVMTTASTQPPGNVYVPDPVKSSFSHPQTSYVPTTTGRHHTYAQRSGTPANTGNKIPTHQPQPSYTPKQVGAPQRHQPTHAHDLVDIKIQLAGKSQARMPPANTGVRRDPKTVTPQAVKAGSKVTVQAPPAVPDAPTRRLQKPPPTPRPQRLPTPDLPEIDGACFCNDLRCTSHSTAQANPNKMDAQSKLRQVKSFVTEIPLTVGTTVQAALAYMKSTREGR
ncbi:hypothetical protein EG329_005986 [Mollisiaceae sp. DMI_Dod_QoI]|nr:hypothetical protein EG329_005986 [Helotiales sp. DMI_Dod_QoI]